jgi:hypothetical protein
MTAWVEEAIQAGCPYIAPSGNAKTGIVLFKNYEGGLLQKALHFRDAYRKVDRLRPPFVQITEYAVQCALKDPRIKKWVTPPKWNSAERKRQTLTLQEV